MHELGLIDEFLKRPHQELVELAAQVGSDSVTIADFRHLRTYCKFLVLMPQWEFLDFLKQHAERYPGFRLVMQAEATELIEADGVVTGLRARTQQGPVEVHASLIVAADGRRSVIRQRANLAVENLGAPMDVMWMRLSRRSDDAARPLGTRIAAGSLCF